MILQDRLGPHGDRFYSALMAAHDGLTPAESHALNARLVLMLANQVADIEVLETLLKLAKDD
jgi:hypothetical protein